MHNVRVVQYVVVILLWVHHRDDCDKTMLLLLYIIHIVQRVHTHIIMIKYHVMCTYGERNAINVIE